MQRYVLTETVHIDGYDFWGRFTTLMLEPTGTTGWFWKVDGVDVPLRPRLVHHERRRLVLRHRGHELHVFEHLGPLRFSGLDGVRFSCSSSWLPYDGRALAFWEAVKPSMREEGTLRPMSKATVANIAQEGKIDRNVGIIIGGTSLRINFDVDYREWGHFQLQRTITDDLEDIFAARSLGRPSWLRPLAVLADKLGRPHLKGVLWPQGMKPSAILEELARHGVLDLLGALSVIAPAGEYLVGTVSGKRTSHENAVQLLRVLEDQLRLD